MAGHFKDFKEKSKISVTDIQPLVRTHVIWQGNAILRNRSFVTLCCTICMQERCEILSLLEVNPTKMMNSRNEIYGAGQHIPKFHRYCITTTKTVSANEGINPQKDSNKKIPDDPNINFDK